MAQTIPITDDAAKEFYEMIEEAAGDKKLDTGAHLYLTELLTGYTKLTHEGPTVHTQETKAFCLQVGDTEEEFPLQRSLRYQRFKSIGDTLLFAVGFLPESVAETRRIARPPLEYYACMGTTAYARAARERFTLRICDGAGDRMNDLAGNFKQYAGILFKVREGCEGMPINRLDVLLKMVELTKEEKLLDPFMIRNPLINFENKEF